MPDNFLIFLFELMNIFVKGILVLIEWFFENFQCFFVIKSFCTHSTTGLLLCEWSCSSHMKINNYRFYIIKFRFFIWMRSFKMRLFRIMKISWNKKIYCILFLRFILILNLINFPKNQWILYLFLSKLKKNSWFKWFACFFKI